MDTLKGVAEMLEKDSGGENKDSLKVSYSGTVHCARGHQHQTALQHVHVNKSMQHVQFKLCTAASRVAAGIEAAEQRVWPCRANTQVIISGRC